MPDAVRVELIYRGTAVDDGTMPVEDLIDALTGFSAAFAKIARYYDLPETKRHVRVVGLQKGSSKVLVEIVDWVIKNPTAATALTGVGTAIGAGAYKVVEFISGVIKGKKALQGQTIANNYVFNDNRVILNDVSLTKEQFDVLRSGELDPDLDRITAPLGEDRGVNEFELKTGDEELVRVSAVERPYLEEPAHYLAEKSVALPAPTRSQRRKATTEEGWFEGTLRSHSKKTNRGTFETLSGERMRYQYAAGDLQPLLRAYASRGTVKVYGRVAFDAAHEPISIEIRDIQPPE
jgi:hypothetical protein